MATQTVRFTLRRGTAAHWTASNPTLHDGEPALETDTDKWKTGDGVTPWNSLAYMPGSRTDAELAEFVRDTIGTALTNGANITITVSDGSDTITIAFTGDLPFANIQQIATAKVLGRFTAGTGDIEELPTTGTGNVVMSVAPTFTGTASFVAAAFSSNVTVGGFLRVNQATGGLGYGVGAGGTVTQTTSKANGVAINRANGTITMNNAALAANTAVQFTLTNNAVEVNDTLVAYHHSGGTWGAYKIETQTTGATTVQVQVTNTTGGSLSEAIVLKFYLIKGSIT